MVIDGLVAGLLITRREATDVIDVRYIAEDPRTAQRIVNSTVHAFQALNVQWARERSRRRREFLAEQLSQTDSTLARAQADLAVLPSRQQIGDSQDALAARQAGILQIETQIERSTPTGRRSPRCSGRLKTADEKTRAEAMRALATSTGDRR